METLCGSTPSYLSSPVEREPMWDGNYLTGEKCTKSNQVEREPMWDGNLPRPTRISRESRVEREPMWDGNPTTTTGWGVQLIS